jgi:hypothetical protein
MLNWISREFLVAVIISLAVVVVGLSLSGPPYQNHQPPREQGGEHSQANDSHPNSGSNTAALQIECDPNCSAKRTDEHRDESRLARLINKTIDDPVALFTFFLGVATFLLVIVVLGQVKDGRESSERQLRAYVSVEGGIIGLIEVGRPIVWEVHCRNVGKTPANKVSIWGGVMPRLLPYNGPFPPGNAVTRGTTGPSDFIRTSGESDYIVEIGFVADLNAGMAAVFIYGECTYVDAFGIDRVTQFRYVHGGERTYRPGVLWKTAEGNDAT